jgi:hypothetical protein
VRLEPVASGPPPASVPSALTAANSESDGEAMSLPSRPSTLSAFKPVATPVALVVNGAPELSPVLM